MFLNVGILAVVVTIIAVGNAQNGAPGPPGVRFPKFGSSPGAPGHNIPEELLIYPDVPLDRYIPGSLHSPEDPIDLVNPDQESHIYSDPRGPIGAVMPFRRFFPNLNQDNEENQRDRRMNFQNDLEP